MFFIWTLLLAQLSQCPVEDAFWLPRVGLKDKERTYLPHDPHLSILCCDGVLGAMPNEKYKVKEVRKFRNRPYAILQGGGTCPLTGSPTLKKSTVETSPHPENTVTKVDRKENDQVRPFGGYRAEPHAKCPYLAKSTVGSPKECFGVCENTPWCTAFTVVGHRCYLSDKCDSLKPGADHVSYIKASPRNTNFHRIKHLIAVGATLMVCSVVVFVAFFSASANESKIK